MLNHNKHTNNIQIVLHYKTHTHTKKVWPISQAVTYLEKQTFDCKYDCALPDFVKYCCTDHKKKLKNINPFLMSLKSY